MSENRFSYVWRDQHDKYIFHFGVKFGNGTLSHWCSLSEDAVGDLFGEDAKQFCKEDVGTTPVEIVLSLGNN